MLQIIQTNRSSTFDNVSKYQNHPCIIYNVSDKYYQNWCQYPQIYMFLPFYF